MYAMMAPEKAKAVRDTNEGVHVIGAFELVQGTMLRNKPVYRGNVDSGVAVFLEADHGRRVWAHGNTLEEALQTLEEILSANESY